MEIKWSQSLLVHKSQGWKWSICSTSNTIIFQSVRSKLMKICEHVIYQVFKEILQLKLDLSLFALFLIHCTRVYSFEVFLWWNYQGNLGVKPHHSQHAIKATKNSRGKCRSWRKSRSPCVESTKKYSNMPNHYWNK